MKVEISMYKASRNVPMLEPHRAQADLSPLT